MSQSYPPGPKNGLLGLHHLARLQRDVLGYAGELARDHGDIVYYRVGPVRAYQLTHPEHIQEVLVKQARRFQRPARTKRVWGKFEGNGLAVSDGDFWLRQRRLVQPAFHPQRLRHYADIMTEFAGKMLDGWESRAEVQVADEMSQLTLAIAARTLFDADLSGQAAGVRDAMAVIQEKTIREMSQAFTLPDWLPLPGKTRERRAIRYLHDLVAGMIRERRVSGADKGDLLSKLLLAVDDEGDHSGMTDKQAEDEAVTLLLAGYETIANALVWTMYLLARHLDVQTRLAENIVHVLAGRMPGVDDLPKLAALERVVKESLRLYPPAYFYSREAVAEAEVGGYRIPRGSLVHFVPYLVHRDPRWFEQPGEFLPDRFLPEREEQLPPFAYFPFGGGPHVCIGKPFAMMEAVLILATVLQRFQLSPPPGQGDPEMIMQITLQLKGGLRAQLKRREA